VRSFYEAGRAERDFDLGIQRALERVLVSPQFLFRIEREPAGAAPGRSTASAISSWPHVSLSSSGRAFRTTSCLMPLPRERCGNPMSCVAR
jgi:hypothetical protein